MRLFLALAAVGGFMVSCGGCLDGAMSQSDQVWVCYQGKPERPIEWVALVVHPIYWPWCRFGLWFAGRGSPTGELRRERF